MSKVLLSIVLGVGLLAFFVLRNARAAADQPAPTGPVSVRVFGADGKLGDLVAQPRVVKTEAEWKQQLSPESFHVAREAGTEAAGSGPLLKNKADGVYLCIGCDLPLFDSATKFESGTGWPSFYQPIARENVTDRPDNSYGMNRTENVCTRCDSHLGHVFTDGPQPTGLRFCINSVSLKFVPRDKLATLATPATQPAGK